MTHLIYTEHKSTFNSSHPPPSPSLSPSLPPHLSPPPRIAGVCKDYCGLLNEESIRLNFVLIYELLDEVLVSAHHSYHSIHTLSFLSLSSPPLPPPLSLRILVIHKVLPLKYSSPTYATSRVMSRTINRCYGNRGKPCPPTRLISR